MTYTSSPRKFAARRLLLGATLLVLGACKSGSEPPVPASVTRVSGDEQPGMINAPLATPLSVRVADADGQPLSGVTVTWTVTTGGGSVSPTSSVTDEHGIATTTWTLGPTPGEQRVTASVGGVSVTFRANASAIVACGADVTLPPGGVCIASASQAAQVQVSAGAGLGEFVAIPYYDGNLVRNAIGVDAIASGAIGVAGPPTPDLLPSAGTGFAANAVLLRDFAFERALRRRERAALRPLVGGGGARLNLAPGSADTPTPTRPRYAVGDVLTLNTNSNSACSNPVNKQGVVRHESANAIYVEDTQNPAGGFTAADWPDIANNFESVIRPSNVEAFGSHTDIDNNQRIIIFYTIEVNKLTPANNPGSVVGGFFFSRDLFPKTGTVTTPSGKVLSACAASNNAEMFYMLAPDPQGTFGNVRSTASVKSTTAGTIAHEYEHLINSSRRLYLINGASFPEAVWLDEGLAHIAEELAYYRAAGFSPRQNLSLSDITTTQQVVDALNNYQLANLSRFNRYLRRTNGHSPYGETPQTDPQRPPDDWDDLESRGAIWSFLRWAADHRGGADGDVWQRLVRDATAVGIDNLRAVFGNDIGSRFREWAGANYIDDAPGVPQNDVTFRHPSWNFRSILLHQVFSNGGSYPLQVFSVANATASFSLVDGGAAYLRFGVPANSSATLRVTASGGGQLPSATSVWIVRTK